MTSKYIQIKEAAEILGVTKLTLRNWDNSGKLVALRHPISNYRVYKKEDIDKILSVMESGYRHPNTGKRKTPTPKRMPDKPKTYTLKVLHLKD